MHASVLNLRDTILVNKKSEKMAHSAEDGYFEFRPLQHDMAAFLDAPGHVTPGDTVLLNITVLNVGLDNETDVELQLLLNGSIANSTIISFLQVGSSYTLSHLWTTSTVEAIHNVTAYAMPVHDENFTLNNMESAIVTVSYVIRVPFHYPKIQQAIEVANPGDTILVSAGTYYEHLTVDKSLKLVSEGSKAPIIDGNGTDVVIRVRADNVMIDRFVIRDGIYGIKVEWHDLTMVIDNTILNNEDGISFGDSYNNIVIGNTLLDNSVSIDLVDSFYNTIYHNNFINNTKQNPGW
jgi:parallel beta-helix repeat protein